MPWSGAGSFARVHNWVNDRDAAIDITASRFDAENDDFAAGIQACLAKNGENVPTANLPMDGNKHTGVAASTAATDYASVGELQDNTHMYGFDLGVADDYQVAMSPTITAYAIGQRFTFVPQNSNTGIATLNIDSLGVKTIKLLSGAQLFANAILANQTCDVWYNGTDFILLNPQNFSTALTGQITSTAAKINTAADKSDFYTNTYTTPAATGTHATTFAHGLGDDECDLVLLLDFTNLLTTDETNLRGCAFNAAGEATPYVGRSAAGTFTGADIPAAGNIGIKIQSGIAKAITVRVTARKRG